MRMDELERIVQGRMFQYSSYKQELASFETAALNQTVKISETGVRGSYISDPTARGGVLLAEPPPKVKEKYEWCAAIDEAHQDCLDEDMGNPFGLAYVMEKNFAIGGEPHPKAQNETYRKRICHDCNIAESTFYVWLKRITGHAIYRAAKRGLI